MEQINPKKNNQLLEIQDAPDTQSELVKEVQEDTTKLEKVGFLTNLTMQLETFVNDFKEKYVEIYKEITNKDEDGINNIGIAVIDQASCNKAKEYQANDSKMRTTLKEFNTPKDDYTWENFVDFYC